MANLGRIVWLLALLTVINSSLGREPVPFVCTNRANFKGDSQNPRDTIGQFTPGNVGSSSLSEMKTASSSFSEGINKQPTFSDGTTGPSIPSKGESGSSSPLAGTSVSSSLNKDSSVSSSSFSGTIESCQSCGDTQTQFITSFQTPPGTNGPSAPSEGKNGSFLSAKSTNNHSVGITGTSTTSKNVTRLSSSSESFNASYSSSDTITGDTQTQSGTTGQTPPCTNGSSAPSKGKNGSSVPAKSIKNLSDGTTGPSSLSANVTGLSLSSESSNESFSSSDAIANTTALFDQTGLSLSSEGSAESSLSFEGSTSSPSPSEGNKKYLSGTIGHTPNGTTFSSAPSEAKIGSNLPPQVTNKSYLPFESTTGISTPSKGETGLSSSKESSTESYLSSESIIASEDNTRKYIFMFLKVQCASSSTTEIFIGTIVSDLGASGNISFPLMDVPEIAFSLLPGSGEIFEVNSKAVPSGSELNQTVNPAVMIVSDEEVVVYGHQRCHGSGNHRATAFRVRGIEDLGTEYWVITHQSKGNSQVGVVAIKNHTHISIDGVYVNKTLNLNKYETFYFGGPYDLTGTYIVADKPILVIAGNTADTSPYSSTDDDIDSFYKCLPPVKNWGRNFTLVPFPSSTKPFTAKILSSHDNGTLEYVDGTASRISVSLSKGEVKVLNSSNVLSIHSSEGILVAQFSKGESRYGRHGNPSMLLTPPYGDAGRSEFIFPVFTLSENNDNETCFITVWLPPASNILIDNKTVSWDEIGEGTNGYRIVQTTLSSSGFHVIHSSKNITTVVCGVGNHKYYCYSLY